jgi:hypothetical protein
MLLLGLLFIVGITLVWLIPFFVNVAIGAAIAIIDRIGRPHPS